MPHPRGRPVGSTIHAFVVRSAPTRWSLFADPEFLADHQTAHAATVRAVLGDNIRPGAVWWAELDRPIANENVTQVIRIDPDTLGESVIWPA